MKCEQGEELINAYLDGELNERRRSELEQHLRSCSACQEELERQRHFRQDVFSQLPRFQAPAELQTKVQAVIRQEERNRSEALAPLRSPWVYVPLGLAAVLLVCFGWVNFNLERRVGSEAVQAYARAQFVDHFCDIVNPDPKAVQSWLAAKLDYAPPVVLMPDSGYEIRGGRIDKIRDRRVAAVVYRKKQQVVNVFTWPETQNEKLTEVDTVRHGNSVCTFNLDKMNFVAVGNISSREMEDFEDQFRDQLK
jgi:anti-sigma factor RsiW